MAELGKHDEIVTITIAEYNRLKSRSNWLHCLEAAGVDNWEGMDYAADLRRENPEEYGLIGEDEDV